ncbi:hypothetical protein DFQ28_001393 [Apophysomyces sp. BC1034]|nr:hypothetical protein DFQ28_001393 [Apophysomyces sp. BC1034]
MEIIFEQSKVKLRAGETQNTASAELQALYRDQADSQRGAFKADVRIVLLHGAKQYDVANCEFAKNGDLERKMVLDNIKVMVEAKCIMDYIAKKCCLSHKEAKKLTIVNLQGRGK